MRIKPSNRLGEVKEYYFSKKLREIGTMRSNGVNVINLGIGSPDLPASETVVTALKASCLTEKAHQYQGYTGIPALKNGFSNWYRKYYQVELNPTNEILPLIGSKEGIMHISMAFLNEGDQVLIPNPGYPTYSSATRLAGGENVPYLLTEENDWQPDFEALEQLNLTKVKIMWVNYPHMPTGANATMDLFEQLVAFGRKHDILICNDNPYSFVLNDHPMSILSVENAKEVALELNSLSKSHNMAGWRMGMVGGHTDYIQTILRFKSNMDSGMFKPIQVAAAEALALPKSWYDELNTVYKERQKVVYELYDLLGCEYDSSRGGMFVWGKVPAQYENSYALSDELLKNSHVFITPGGIFGSQGTKYIRASLCNEIPVFKTAIERIKAQFK